MIPQILLEYHAVSHYPYLSKGDSPQEHPELMMGLGHLRKGLPEDRVK
jgi:hypothetical protein